MPGYRSLTRREPPGRPVRTGDRIAPHGRPALAWATGSPPGRPDHHRHEAAVSLASMGVLNHGAEDDRRLLLVLAHPDDEAIGTGATMAKYAAEGAHVALDRKSTRLN